MEELVADEKSVLAGWALARYFTAHATRAYGVRFVTTRDRQADIVAAWVASQVGQQATVRDLARAKRGGITTVSAAASLFTYMQDRGMGRVTTKKGRGGTQTSFTLAGTSGADHAK